MNASGSYDAIVIGAGVGGLAASAYLARAGARVLILEAGERCGGTARTIPLAEGAEVSLFAPTLHALDARVVHELHLGRYGFALVQGDMARAGLRGNGRHFVLTRRSCAERSTAEALRARDIEAYGRFTGEAFAFARKLRPLWLEAAGASPEDESDPCGAASRICGLDGDDAERLSALCRMSAAGWLETWFDSDALKAVLGFDAISDSLASDEPGSALMLLWRFAQSFHRQGAAVQVKGGSGGLIAALELAARRAGAEVRMKTRAAAILAANGRVGGVVAADGAELRAPAVLSSLDARRTLLELAPPDAIGFGTAARIPCDAAIGRAQIAFVLAGPPPFIGLERADLRARLIVAAWPESASEAKAAALAGALGADPVMEVTVPTAADPELAPEGRHIVVVSLPFAPIAPREGWEKARAALTRHVIAALDDFAPGLKDRILATRIVAPAEIAPRARANALARLLAPYESRVATPVDGLYLCGGSAEPADGVCGRAGRVAARLALARRLRENAA